MIKDRKSCNRPRARWAHRHRVKPGKVKARAVALSELDSASLHIRGNGQPARGGEACTCAVARSDARTGFPGVKGDSARRQNRRELGRPAAAVGALCPGKLGLGINNQAGCCGGESEGSVVARRTGITGRSEGTLVRNMRSQKQPVLIGDKPKTEETVQTVESIGCRDRSWAASPSPAEPAGHMSGGRVGPDVSRMREIRTFGSTRGRAAYATWYAAIETRTGETPKRIRPKPSSPCAPSLLYYLCGSRLVLETAGDPECRVASSALSEDV